MRQEAMVSVPSWMTAPRVPQETQTDEAQSSPVGTPLAKKVHRKPAAPWPAGKSTSDMLALANGLIAQLMPLAESAGDIASSAIEQLQVFAAATRDHEFHGRNWWAQNADRIGAQLAVFFPEWLPRYKVVEGEELYQLFRKVFPDGRSHRGSDQPEIDQWSYDEIRRHNEKIRARAADEEERRKLRGSKTTVSKRSKRGHA